MPFKPRSIVAFALVVYVLYITMKLIESKIKKDIQSGNHGIRHWFLTSLSFVGGITSGYIITKTPAWSFFQQRLLGLAAEDKQADYATYLEIEGVDKAGAGGTQSKMNQSSLSISNGEQAQG